MEAIQTAVHHLKNGDIICYPTDTIWGIGCDAKNSAAVGKINELKQRAEGKSYVVIVHRPEELVKIFDEIPDIAWELIDIAVDPMTLILDGPKGLAPEVLAEDGSVAIRVVGSGFAHDVAKRFNGPIVSTSANISGQPSPSSAQDLSEEIKQGVDHLVPSEYDSGNGKASTIIRVWADARVKIIRK